MDSLLMRKEIKKVMSLLYRPDFIIQNVFIDILPLQIYYKIKLKNNI